MKIKLELKKDTNQNAQEYYNQSKKLKKKIPGLLKAIKITKEEIEKEKNKIEEELKTRKIKEIIESENKNWYDKFRWTYTSNNYLFVIGKDSSTNEALIKKHLGKNDIVIHTENPGSPFGILKNARSLVEKEERITDLIEASEFLLAFSKDWKKGLGTADTFWVYPEQISKTPKSGEYISKGSFIITGKKNILKNIPVKICFGYYIEIKKIETEKEEFKIYKFISGGEKYIQKKCNKYVKLIPGTNNYKTIKKEIQKRLKIKKLPDLTNYIPNNTQITK